MVQDAVHTGSWRIQNKPSQTGSGGHRVTMGMTSRLCFLEGTNTHMQLPRLAQTETVNIPNRVTPITTPPPPLHLYNIDLYLQQPLHI